MCTMLKEWHNSSQNVFQHNSLHFTTQPFCCADSLLHCQRKSRSSSEVVLENTHTHIYITPTSDLSTPILTDVTPLGSARRWWQRSMPGLRGQALVWWSPISRLPKTSKTVGPGKMEDHHRKGEASGRCRSTLLVPLKNLRKVRAHTCYDMWRSQNEKALTTKCMVASRVRASQLHRAVNASSSRVVKTENPRVCYFQHPAVLRSSRWNERKKEKKGRIKTLYIALAALPVTSEHSWIHKCLHTCVVLKWDQSSKVQSHKLNCCCCSFYQCEKMTKVCKKYTIFRLKQMFQISQQKFNNI